MKKRMAERQKAASQSAARQDEKEEKEEADKTPTAQSPADLEEGLVEDDEEFERRFRETEKMLQERLEKLTLKLKDNDEVKGDDIRAVVDGAPKDPPESDHP